MKSLWGSQATYMKDRMCQKCEILGLRLLISKLSLNKLINSRDYIFNPWLAGLLANCWMTLRQGWRTDQGRTSSGPNLDKGIWIYARLHKRRFSKPKRSLEPQESGGFWPFQMIFNIWKTQDDSNKHTLVPSKCELSVGIRGGDRTLHSAYRGFLDV